MPTTKAGFEQSLGSTPAAMLSISPYESDHSFLHTIIDPEWTLTEAFNLTSGLAGVREDRFAIVLCDGDFRPGSWKDILAETLDLAHPPHLIVTSRLADEALWAEVLNLGAYDVLAKPFEAQEVQRVVAMAWQNWEREHCASLSPIPAHSVPRMKRAKKSLDSVDRRHTKPEAVFLTA